MTNTKKLVFTAACIALCVLLPMVVHSVPNAGSVILPMHIPVLICGLAAGWPFGLVCGLIGPLLSSLLTGMPPAPVLPGMMVECAVYGCVSGLMMQLVRTRKLYADLYISMITAMVVGRILEGVHPYARRTDFAGMGNRVFRNRHSRYSHSACNRPDARVCAHEGKGHSGKILKYQQKGQPFGCPYFVLF